jgi:hypothetical protein
MKGVAGMELSSWIGIWGGVVSTSLGVLQFINWRHARPRLVVSCAISNEATSLKDDGTTVGKLVHVQRGRDVLSELVTVRVTVVNHGDKALQLAAIVVESLAEERVNVQHVIPDPLPTVLEPRTGITLDLQKEYLDMADQIVFFGVVDALARRHSVPAASAKSVISQSWDLPSRGTWFRRKDDPTSEPVRAFQTRQSSSMNSRPATKKDRPFITRQPLTPPSRP